SVRAQCARTGIHGESRKTNLARVPYVQSDCPRSCDSMYVQCAKLRMPSMQCCVGSQSAPDCCRVTRAQPRSSRFGCFETMMCASDGLSGEIQSAPIDLSIL